MTESLDPVRRAGPVAVPGGQERSIGQLLGDATREISTLIRQEAELAKAELRESAGRAGKGAGLLAAAALAAVFTLLFLSTALWWALGLVIGHGWSAVIVAVLWAVVAIATGLAGRKELSSVRGLPETTETISKIPNALKGKEEENR